MAQVDPCKVQESKEYLYFQKQAFMMFRCIVEVNLTSAHLALCSSHVHNV